MVVEQRKRGKGGTQRVPYLGPGRQERRRRAAVRAAAALRAGREELEVAEVVVGRRSGAGRPLYSRGEAVARLGVGGGR